MRHTVHLMFGKQSEALLCHIKKYVIKYGESQANPYFNAILCTEQEDGSLLLNAVEVKESDENVFVSGLENLYEVELKQLAVIPIEGYADYLNNFLRELYNSKVTINNPGDSHELNLCMYLPAYDLHLWELVQSFIRGTASIRQRYNVDIFVLPADLAFLFDDDKSTLPTRLIGFRNNVEQVMAELVALKKNTQRPAHIILMQNCNSKGVALNLDSDSFVRIVGEYGLLTVSHYTEMFNFAAEDPDRPIHALGLSVLSFDKYYFVQYLLRKAYIHILGRERVTQDEVDVNKVSTLVQNILLKNVNILSDLYEKEIKPQLNDKVDQETIIANVRPKLDEKIAQLTSDFQYYIEDPNLSLPEKRAALAQLLGNDDDLLSGYMFNKKQLTIEDCDKEVLELFVSANNALLQQGEVSIENKEHPETLKDYAVLSRDGEPVHIPLDDLKALRVSMRESSNYVRQKTRELDALSGQLKDIEESKKRLTSEGFVHEGKTYHIHQQVETPLEEDYQPLSNNNQRSVDLRKLFTRVKDQGEQGACTVFALASIYEYILKKNKKEEADLSEAFVYYNIRKGNNQEYQDNGCSFYDAILSMTKEGICQETLFPYNDSSLATIPPENAYADARIRQVRKALNVKPTIEDMKSAIAEGFPVAISLKIYDSFATTTGFIGRPSEQEIASKKFGHHAMVACGYSDEERVFIVRNSWGERFGDKGYCYIPYSYIGDPNLLNMACVITEVSVNVQVKGAVTTVVSFNTTDVNIKSAILKNLIEEERIKLGEENIAFNEQSKEYNKLFQAVGNNGNREAILQGTQYRLDWEINELQRQKSKLEAERTETLSLFDKGKRLIAWMFWGYIALIIFFYGNIIYHGLFTDLFWEKWSYISGGITLIIIVWYLLWVMHRKRLRNDIDRDYKGRISTISKKIAERHARMNINHLKMHLAGMIIDNLAKLYHNLQSKYNGMCSFLGNLLTWYHEESDEITSMDALTRDPFISLITNEQLDAYFERKKEEITQDLKLYTMFARKYQISETMIIQFKNGLKSRIIELLSQAIADFKIYSHISQDIDYPFLDNKYTDIDKILKQMDFKSEVFARLSSLNEAVDDSNTFCRIILLKTDREEEKKEWNQIYPKSFYSKPLASKIDSPYKLTLVKMRALTPDSFTL